MLQAHFKSFNNLTESDDPSKITDWETEEQIEVNIIKEYYNTVTDIESFKFIFF